MSFQKTVGFSYTYGFVGQIILEVPHVVIPWRLDGQTANPNTFGLAYTHSADGVGAAPQFGNAQIENVATVGGAGAFAGILVNPQEFALQGTADGALTPTLSLPPYSRAQLMTKGQCVVQINSAVTWGAALGFLPATGEIVLASAEGATAISAVVRNTTTAAGPTTIELL